MNNDKQTVQEVRLNPATNRQIVHADALFGNARQLTIEHAGEAYVLSKTRQNKLLLTKQAPPFAEAGHITGKLNKLKV